MRLFITDAKIESLSGLVIKPEHMASKMTHLSLASQTWDTLYIDITEDIPEGALRLLAGKCKDIKVWCQQPVSLHQLHLLIELYPPLDGKLRKEFMRGGDVSGVLPSVWEHGSET